MGRVSRVGRELAENYRGTPSEPVRCPLNKRLGWGLLIINRQRQHKDQY